MKLLAQPQLVNVTVEKAPEMFEKLAVSHCKLTHCKISHCK